MHGAAPAPSRADASGRIDLFLLGAIAVLLLARLPIIPIRVFDPDEFEHVHAAWSVFRGLVPYRDFFEHHTPWYYFALAPFFRWFAVDQSFESARHFLIFARLVSLALTALSTGLVYLIARAGATRRVGLLAALFFLAQPVLIQKTLEIRPDVPALPFFLGGLWFLLRGLRAADGPAPRDLRWFLGGGLCFGAAIMCTQKMLFVLPGAFTGLGLWALAGRGRAFGLRVVAVSIALVGVAVPLAVTWAAFAAHGGGAQFIHNNFILNAKWKAHSSRHLLVTLATSWPIAILCLLGAWEALQRVSRTPARERGYCDVALFATFAGSMAGLLVVPVAYRQYYLMPLPIACVFAARGLCSLVARAREQSRARLLVGVTAVLLIWPAVDLALSFTRRADVQMARLQYVFAHTAPTDTVLDGWLGAAVFRPHPLYYAFMHGEVRAMLSDAQKDAYVAALESGWVRPALIVLDEELVAMGPRLVRFVRSNYASADGLFYLRR